MALAKASMGLGSGESLHWGSPGLRDLREDVAQLSRLEASAVRDLAELAAEVATIQVVTSPRRDVSSCRSPTARSFSSSARPQAATTQANIADLLAHADEAMASSAKPALEARVAGLEATVAALVGSIRGETAAALQESAMGLREELESKVRQELSAMADRMKAAETAVRWRSELDEVSEALHSQVTNVQQELQTLALALHGQVHRMQEDLSLPGSPGFVDEPPREDAVMRLHRELKETQTVLVKLEEDVYRQIDGVRSDLDATKNVVKTEAASFREEYGEKLRRLRQEFSDKLHHQAMRLEGHTESQVEVAHTAAEEARRVAAEAHAGAREASKSICEFHGITDLQELTELGRPSLGAARASLGGGRRSLVAVEGGPTNQAESPKTDFLRKHSGHASTPSPERSGRLSLSGRMSIGRDDDGASQKASSAAGDNDQASPTSASPASASPSSRLATLAAPRSRSGSTASAAGLGGPGRAAPPVRRLAKSGSRDSLSASSQASRKSLPGVPAAAVLGQKPPPVARRASASSKEQPLDRSSQRGSSSNSNSTPGGTATAKSSVSVRSAPRPAASASGASGDAARAAPSEATNRLLEASEAVAGEDAAPRLVPGNRSNDLPPTLGRGSQRDLRLPITSKLNDIVAVPAPSPPSSWTHVPAPVGIPQGAIISNGLVYLSGSGASVGSGSLPGTPRSLTPLGTPRGTRRILLPAGASTPPFPMQPQWQQRQVSPQQVVQTSWQQGPSMAAPMTAAQAAALRAQLQGAGALQGASPRGSLTASSSRGVIIASSVV